jgi:hypothetical protein
MPAAWSRICSPPSKGLTPATMAATPPVAAPKLCNDLTSTGLAADSLASKPCGN